MASVFDQVSQGVQKTASGAIEGARSAVQNVSGQVSGAASQLLADPVGVVTGAAGGLLQEVGGEIIGSVSSGGGLGGLLAGALGGILNSASVRPWGNLNPNLLAQFSVCDSNGNPVADTHQDFGQLVIAPITEANFEATFNWQSPFESSGPESKAPQLMALLQSGQFGTIINSLQIAIPGLSGNSSLGGVADQARQTARDLEGRTGITKLNSRQVFSGMPPIRMTMTLQLRALTDPESEVLEPYRRLLRWSLPQYLAANGTLAEVISNAGDAAGMVNALFPSKAPALVAMTYGGQTFKPMVIESLSNPLDGPRYRDGKFLYLPVQLTLATLTALDREDVQKLFLK